MKTTFTKLLVTIMMVTGFSAYSSGKTTEHNLKVSRNNQKAVVLQLAKLSEKTRISIWDAQGTMLFEEETNEGTYTKTFDLEPLKAGRVYVRIESEEQLEILPVEISNSSAQVKRSAEQIIKKPVVKVKGNIAKVFFGDNDSQVKVSIFDEAGNIAFREKIDDSTGSRKYDMSKLGAGSYEFKFRTKGQTFYHTIILD